MHPLHLFKFCPVCGSCHFAENDSKSRRCTDCGFVYYLNPSAATVAFITDGKGGLLVERRGREPGRGTLDLPGGFTDMGETVEQGVAREVWEETGLKVTATRYLFSYPNTYRFSGFDVPTLDFFFLCEVATLDTLKAADDAAACSFLPIEKLSVEEFGLKSIRRGLTRFLKERLWEER